MTKSFELKSTIVKLIWGLLFSLSLRASATPAVPLDAASFTPKSQAERIVKRALEEGLVVYKIPFKSVIERQVYDYRNEMHTYKESIEGRPRYLIRLPTGDVLVNESNYEHSLYYSEPSTRIIAVHGGLTKLAHLDKETENDAYDFERQLAFAKHALSFAQRRSNSNPNLMIGVRRLSDLEHFVRRTVDSKYTVFGPPGEISIIENKDAADSLTDLFDELRAVHVRGEECRALFAD